MNIYSSFQVVATGSIATLLLSTLDGQAAKYAMYVLSAIFLFLGFIWSANKIAGLMILLLPNQRLFVLDDGGISMLNILLISALLSLLIFRTKEFKSVLNAQIYLLLAVMLLAYVLQYFIIYGSFLDALFAVKFILITVFFVLLLDRARNRRDLAIYLGYFYVLGGILGTISGVLSNDSFDLGMRFTTNENTSPNNTAAHAAFGIAVLLAISSVRGMNLRSAILLVLLLITGLLTQSRSFILAAIVSGLVYTLFGKAGNGGLKTALITLGYLALVTGAFVFLLQFTPLGGVSDTAIERVINPRNEDITNNRLGLWLAYFDQWTSSLHSFLLGIGSDDINSRLGLEYVAHNFLLEAAVAYGITGLMLIVGIYYSIWHRFRLKSITGFHPVFYLPLAIAVLTSLTGHGLMGMQFIIQFIISLIMLNYCISINAANRFKNPRKLRDQDEAHN